LTLLCIVIALSGCTTAQGERLPTPNSVQPTVAGTNLSFTTIAQGEHLSANLFVHQPSIIIIASAQEVDAALRQAGGNPPELTSKLHPIDKVRQLDFNRYVALLVLQGKQSTNGFSVTVKQIMRQGDQVKVLANFIQPNGAAGDIGTDPYHLVAIPKEDLSGKLLKFELVDDTKVVAETAHSIP